MVKVAKAEIKALADLCEKTRNDAINDLSADTGLEVPAASETETPPAKKQKLGLTATGRTVTPGRERRPTLRTSIEHATDLPQLSHLSERLIGEGVTAAIAAPLPAMKAAAVASINTFLPPPKEGLTGVKEDITIACAKLSAQIYTAKEKVDFALSSRELTATCFIFDNHGEFDQAIPAFAAATTDDGTMILGWRGTQSPLDWISDFSIAPVASSRWGKEVVGGIRAHGMYSSFIESDLATHEAAIIDTIARENIEKLVFTGHSLAGGMAQLAHLFIRAQIKDTNGKSPWKDLDLDCRALTFAAPMTMMDVDEVDAKNTSAKELMDELSKNCCNIVFGSDVVPRGYAHVRYVLAAVQAALPEAVAGKLLWGMGSRTIANWLISRIAEQVGDAVPVAVKYRHMGSIVHYTHAGADPVELIDEGPGTSNDPNVFSYYDYMSYGTPRGKHIETLTHDHLFFPKSFAQGI